MALKNGWLVTGFIIQNMDYEGEEVKENRKLENLRHKGSEAQKTLKGLAKQIAQNGIALLSEGLQTFILRGSIQHQERNIFFVWKKCEDNKLNPLKHLLFSNSSKRKHIYISSSKRPVRFVYKLQNGTGYWTRI